jgi:hypothetical protein
MKKFSFIISDIWNAINRHTTILALPIMPVTNQQSRKLLLEHIYIYIYIYIGFLDRIKEHTVGIYRLLVLQSSIGIISRIPESVGEPYRISNHCISIIITVPNKVSMGSVLDIQHAMTETGFTKSRVTWLWFRHHTAPQEENMYNLINTV